MSAHSLTVFRISTVTRWEENSRGSVLSFMQFSGFLQMCCVRVCLCMVTVVLVCLRTFVCLGSLFLHACMRAQTLFSLSLSRELSATLGLHSRSSRCGRWSFCTISCPGTPPLCYVCVFTDRPREEWRMNDSLLSSVLSSLSFFLSFSSSSLDLVPRGIRRIPLSYSPLHVGGIRRASFLRFLPHARFSPPPFSKHCSWATYRRILPNLFPQQIAVTRAVHTQIHTDAVRVHLPFPLSPLVFYSYLDRDLCMQTYPQSSLRFRLHAPGCALCMSAPLCFYLSFRSRESEEEEEEAKSEGR